MSPPNSPTASSHLWLGVVYHPEHWPEERWSVDASLMAEAGLNVVRLAACAWDGLEPSPGRFSFDWLDRALSVFAEAGLAAVLAAPDCVPPAWLVQRYPAVLALDRAGKLLRVGRRPCACVNADELRAAAGTLATAMAQQFGRHQQVIGWQIAGECRQICYCPRCRDGFRRHLAARYGSLDELNLVVTTNVRGEAFGDWDQVQIPIDEQNPPLMLEFRRFVTESHRQFQDERIEAIRPYIAEEVWLTGRSLGWDANLDPYTLSATPDRVSSEFSIAPERRDFHKASALWSFARGVKRKNYWVLDSGAEDAQNAARSVLQKDETQALVWQAIAHGADGVVAWNWRPTMAGVDYQPNSLLDRSGQPRPFLDEVKLLGLEFSALSPWLAGSTTAKARVAILNSFDSRWTLEESGAQPRFDYVEYLEHWHRPLSVRNVAVDILPPSANLDQYKMVIAPALSVLDEQLVARLTELVRHSGHLVLTLRTGTRDAHGALLPLRQPGPLSTIAGVEVEDTYLLEEPIPVKGNWFEGVSRRWAERISILDPNKAVKIARYGVSNGWLDNEIAITVCAQGTGLTYVVGAYLDVAAQQAMVDHFLQNAGLARIDTPPGVEVQVRVRPEGEQIFIVINHDGAPATVTLPSPARNPLTNQPVHGPFRLSPFGVAVLLKDVPLPQPSPQAS